MTEPRGRDVLEDLASCWAFDDEQRAALMAPAPDHDTGTVRPGQRRQRRRCR